MKIEALQHDLMTTVAPMQSAAPHNQKGTSAASTEVSVDSVKAFEAVDNFLNLGSPDRLDGFLSLSPEEQDKFAEILAKMIQKGLIGYEVLHVNGQAQRVDLANQIGEKITYYNSPIRQEYKA